MSLEPDSKAWQDALRNAPDEYEVHTVYKRYQVGPAGRRVWQQRPVGRRVVANGAILFEEYEGQ